ITEVPDQVDLAVILTPAKTVPSILEECGQKGIRRVIIETAGFREYGEGGRQLEQEIQQIAHQYSIRFIGPNCIGAINMENGFCVPFARLTKFVKPGDVSIITQSGGVGMSALNLMANEGLGLNKFVSIGNMLDVSAEDLLEYLIEDEGTNLVFVYLESINDGRRLMEIARKSHKPILIFKANIGSLGQKIALSHTASLASDDRVVDAAFHQSGVIRVRDATSLGNNLKILRLPSLKGKNLAVISRSGGHAVLAADACELAGFNLAHFPDKFLREIESYFRASVIRLTNPLDLGDLFDLDMYARIVEQTLQLPSVDGVVFLHTSLSEGENLKSRQLLERVMDLVKRYDKPIAYYISTAAQEVNYLKQSYSYPIFTQVVETVRALKMSHYYHKQTEALFKKTQPPSFNVNRGKIRHLIESAASQQRDLLLSEALEIVSLSGVTVTQNEIASTPKEATQAAERMGYPLVLKVISSQITHKSDVGGVQLNLSDADSVKKAFEKIAIRIKEGNPQALIEGVLLQPMVTGGRELILGGRQDPQFGAVVLLGLGGIFVEVFKEVVVRVAPISKEDAWEMIESLRGAKILKGVRGQKPADLEAVVDALLRISQLLCDFPEIKELDINPLRVYVEGKGCQALDARIILH
ncbi:MAG: acetate--CoA ligase family protein, partial [Anaerolineales bacterium]|nr:acetate--CoA ligase family protein [Anaerolineales bacterium]